MIILANTNDLKAMRIGVDGVVCAFLKDGTDTPTTAPSYTDKPGSAGAEGVLPLPGVMTLNINPNASIETAFYDDGPGEVASTLGNIEVTFNKSAIGPTEKAYLLGKSLVEVGTGSKAKMVVSSSNDTPPWVALGFRTLRSDGTYRYVWLYKGKFIEPADNNETKGESVNFQSDELTGRFVKLNYEFTVGSKKLKPWKNELEETDDATEGKKLVAAWLTKVILPNYTISSSLALNETEEQTVVEEK